MDRERQESRARAPALSFWVSRVGLFLVAWLGLVVWPVELSPIQWQAFADAPWLDGWARFDSAWYLDLWTEGYRYEPGEPSNANFFPLFAVLSGLASLPLRSLLGQERAFYVAGIGLSLLAFRLALGGLHRLAWRRCDRRVADRTVWLLALFPFSLFFGAAYTESLYLAVAVGAFGAMERDRWGLASSLGAAASLTRVPGFLVLVGLGAEWLWRRRGQWRRHSRELAFLTAGALPLLSLLAWFWWRFGTPVPFVRTQLESWGREIGLGSLLGELRTIADARTFQDLPLLHMAYLALLPIALGLSVVVWRRLGPGYSLFCLLSIALAASSGLPGLGRYLSVLFPLFVAAALLLRRPLTYRLVLVLFVPFLILCTLSFTHWHLVN